MIKTLNPSPLNEYQELAKVDFQVGSKKSDITLSQFFNFLIEKKILPQSEYVRKIIKCSSSAAKNDILVISVNGKNVYIDLFGALIEIDGYISTTERSGNWSMRVSTSQKSTDSRCEKNATFTYRCCSGTSWTKEVSSKDISSSVHYETLLGEISKCSEDDNVVVSVKTLNSLVDAINKVLSGLKTTDDVIKTNVSEVSKNVNNISYEVYDIKYDVEDLKEVHSKN